MSKYVMINVSPRRRGTSVMLIEAAKARLEREGHICEMRHLYPMLKKADELIASVSQADIILISGPCYVNTYPADMIRLLELLASHPEAVADKPLYGMIQGGMPYVHTHQCGLDMLAIFAEEVGMLYCGGFVLGLGAALNGADLSKLPNAKKAIKAYDKFCMAMHNQHKVALALSLDAQFRVPSWIFKALIYRMNGKLEEKFE